MVATTVELAPESKRHLEELFRTMPKETRRAFGLACSIVVRRMRRRMNPRSHELAPWDNFTKQFRALLPEAHFGGSLMGPDGKGKPICMYQPPGTDRTVIGWVDAMEDPALKFQEGGSEPTNFSRRYKRWMVFKGIDRHIIPKIADTPARPVVDPVTQEASRDFANWVLGALDKVLQGKIKGAALRYEKSPATMKGYRAAKTVADMGDRRAQIIQWQREEAAAQAKIDAYAKEHGLKNYG